MNINISPLFRKIAATSIFCIVLLLGFIAGLIIFPAETVNRAEQAQITGRQERQERQERIIEPRYDALDPVSGDWGITANELISRINATLDTIGVRRGDKIVNWNFTESRKEFRHSFSPSLSMLGELSENDNVQRVAIYFDPAFDVLNFPMKTALIRALIAATDPSLARETIHEMIDSLEVSLYAKSPRRQVELRHNNFLFSVWPVVGSAFVFMASPAY